MYYKLIRKPAEGNAVRGKLYYTSHYFNKRTGIITERLHYICDTLENADYLVPALIYRVAVTQSPKFKRLLPVLQQVPGKNDVRVIGVPSVNQRSVCDGESGAGPSTFSNDGVVSSCTEGRARSGIRIHRGTKPEHSLGCLLVSPYMEQSLTARFLSEQTAHEECRLEICAAQ